MNNILVNDTNDANLARLTWNESTIYLDSRQPVDRMLRLAAQEWEQANDNLVHAARSVGNQFLAVADAAAAGRHAGPVPSVDQVSHYRAQRDAITGEITKLVWIIQHQS